MPYILAKDRLQFEYAIDGILTAVDNPESYGEKNPFSFCAAIADKIKTTGDLNYVISSLVWRTFDKNPRYSTADVLIDMLENVLHDIPDFDHVLSDYIYHICCGVQEKETFNSVRGTLRCVILEFYRRKVAVLEDKKINENGDIQ